MLQELNYVVGLSLFTLGRICNVALIAAFIILLIDKLGIRSAVVEKSRFKLLSDLFSCDFCLSFWVSFFICSVLAIESKNIQYLMYPLFSTPITRILL